ncbi:DUF5107 domain-containing protein [Virgisporangium aurantiacum]|uniref:DUF5107 domain-containing protein n=1 Tax=Virgisporangium aurantiacum TaxID=175570 RepID=A0A8J3ZMB7_9ACTN|nr:DUF5107 domain-containing protein [Virgisporangium aurantiacum]GIJ64605.1 hypothetical protein Vau01_121210 [Virgisporangium aurantiacum]
MTSPFLLPDAPADLAARIRAGGAVAWEHPVTIDTYATGAPEALPVFSESRVYQGSTGRIYPLPLIERIDAVKAPRAWDAFHLENPWVRLMVLPALGGRIHVGYDKVAGYDFFYRNNVIKPALVGLTGPWISGGVEFNWPQHHRPATYLPVDAEIETAPDGSVTVWCTDHDPFARMRASHGVTLRPDSALIELRVRLHNRTEERQTFLWWANVAARSHDRYQSFFPPDVRFVADHARRAVTAFPRADRPYYGVVYPARVDTAHPDADRLDFYANIPVPTSYMILETRDDFFGGYDHAADAGFVHWADRRIAPGKKQWTWGNAPFGHAWDRQLTDADGPYVELMAGVFTDNQPDFSYLAPGEVREFSQYWYPISRIGVPLHATTRAALSLERTDAGLRVGLASPTRHSIRIVARTAAGDRVEHPAEVGPDEPVIVVLDLDVGSVRDVSVEVLEGELSIAHWSAPEESGAEPTVATAPPAPHEIASSDELYLTGVHVAQYRHPTRDPEPYWREAVARDPGDSRPLVALAAQAYRRAEYAAAQELLTRAIARQTRHNSNPADTEAYYRLGLVLLRLGREGEALDAFGRAQWSLPWSAPARLELARADLRADRPDDALARRLDSADPRAAAIAVIALRRLDRRAEADATLARALRDDPRDRWLRSLAGSPDDLDGRTLIDLAGEYRRVGDTTAALELLARAAYAPASDAGDTRPVAGYLSAAILLERARLDDAATARWRDLDGVFPAGLDEHDALATAAELDPNDPTAPDLLGIWLYDAGRRAEALAAWRRARHAGGDRAVLLRNLALATATVEGDEHSAARIYDAAIRRSEGSARLLLERDILARRLEEPAESRLARLDAHPGSIEKRDDLVVLRADLLTDLGRAAEALDLLDGRTLRAWEGGEGLALAARDRACLTLARAALARGDRFGAFAETDRALSVPHSLGEDRHLLDSLAEIRYLRGLALGDRAEWAAGVDDPADPVRHPERVVDAATAYVGFCALALGDEDRAERCWAAIEERASRLRETADRVDYFATSVPELSLFGLDTGHVARQAAELERLARAGRSAAGGRRPTLVD